jgi:hypothetical protein
MAHHGLQVGHRARATVAAPGQAHRRNLRCSRSVSRRVDVDNLGKIDELVRAPIIARHTTGGDAGLGQRRGHRLVLLIQWY